MKSWTDDCSAFARAGGKDAGWKDQEREATNFHAAMIHASRPRNEKGVLLGNSLVQVLDHAQHLVDILCAEGTQQAIRPLLFLLQAVHDGS